MEVIVGKYAGFCAGIRAAVEKTEKATIENNGIYCLGEVVHNRQVVENLEAEGLKVINSIDEVPAGSKMIIRSHGERKETYELAEKKNIEIIDATCKFVKLVQDKVKKASKDSFVIIIGEKGHAETIGEASFADGNYYIVEEEADILDSYLEFEKTNFDKVYVCGQTTFSSKKFDYLAKEIKHNFYEVDVFVDKTVCNATEIKQKECDELSKQVDCMIVIGGKNSSNTEKLVNISRNNLQKVFWIQTLDNLEKEDLSGINKIGIVAGASTPKYIIDEVKEYLERNFGKVS